MRRDTVAEVVELVRKMEDAEQRRAQAAAEKQEYRSRLEGLLVRMNEPAPKAEAPPAQPDMPCRRCDGHGTVDGAPCSRCNGTRIDTGAPPSPPVVAVPARPKPRRMPAIVAEPAVLTYDESGAGES